MYLSKKDLTARYGISLRTVDRIYKAMSEDRNYVNRIRWIGGRVRIDEHAFDEAIRTRR